VQWSVRVSADLTTLRFVFVGELLKLSKDEREQAEALGLLQRAYDVHSTKLG